MQPWENALNKFLERYINEPWFDGALLCGSYASGNQNKFSDIDVVIVASENIGWSDRGCCYIDGFLVEYFIDTPTKYKEYMANLLRGHKPFIQHFFVYGKILQDPNGSVAKLREYAQADLAKPLEPMPENSRNFLKYLLWDSYDELKSLAANGWHIDLQYWVLVNSLITAYYDFANIAHAPLGKLEQILTDCKFAEKYHIKENPPKEFTEKLMACMKSETKDDKMMAIDDFYNYVINCGGGFDIGKFSTR